MPELCTFAPMSMKKQDITQKTAIVKALEERGGRARLTDIYPRVIELATFKEDSNKEATIRATMQRHPELFRHSPGKPDGWWELTSYQEEVAALKQQVLELKERNRQLRSMPRATDIIEKMLPEMMDVCMHDRMKADSLRIVLRHLGYEEAAAVLDAWISEKEDELVKALENLRIHIHNIAMTEQNAEIKVNNQFTGAIQHMQVSHADVAVGVAEQGSNVFHHQSNNVEAGKNHGR